MLYKLNSIYYIIGVHFKPLSKLVLANFKCAITVCLCVVIFVTMFLRCPVVIHLIKINFKSKKYYFHAKEYI